MLLPDAIKLPELYFICPKLLTPFTDNRPVDSIVIVLANLVLPVSFNI